MAISRFKTSSVAQGLPKYQKLWDGVVKTPITSGLMLYLDAANTSSYSGSGTAWNDLSGSSNNFTLSNQSFVSAGAKSYIGFSSSSPTTGSCSNTIFGNGTTTSWTISIWVWGNGTTPDPQEWVSQWSAGNSGNSFFFGPRTFSGGTASIYLGDGSAVGSITYPTAQWVNWVGVNDVSGNKQYIYRNGTLVGTINNKAVYTGTANTLLGHQRTAGEYFDGRMSVVRAFNRAITASEVSQDFNSFRGRFDV